MGGCVLTEEFSWITIIPLNERAEVCIKMCACITGKFFGIFHHVLEMQIHTLGLNRGIKLDHPFIEFSPELLRKPSTNRNKDGVGV